MNVVFNPLVGGGVLLATAATDAVYVMFTSAVETRRRIPAATWSSVWYLLSSYTGDQLHRKLDLCRICGCKLMVRCVRLRDRAKAPHTGSASRRSPRVTGVDRDASATTAVVPGVLSWRLTWPMARAHSVWQTGPRGSGVFQAAGSVRSPGQGCPHCSAKVTCATGRRAKGPGPSCG